MAGRADKSGFAAEAQRKIHEKYDEELASKILTWINEVSGASLNTDGNVDNFTEQLKDGSVLCTYVIYQSFS